MVPDLRHEGEETERTLCYKIWDPDSWSQDSNNLGHPHRNAFCYFFPVENPSTRSKESQKSTSEKQVISY